MDRELREGLTPFVGNVPSHTSEPLVGGPRERWRAGANGLTLDRRQVTLRAAPT